MNEYAELRSQTYRFFAGLLEQPLSDPQWEELVIWAGQIDGSGFLSSVQEWILNNASLGKTKVQSLAKDFTRLFTGIAEEYGPPPPYEHLYRQDVDPSSCKAAVLRCYLDSNIQPRDPYRNTSDHIVAELQYMALLAAQQSRQIVGLPEGYEAALSPQQYFLNKHLLTWVSQWHSLVATHPGQRGFYPKITEALVSFLQQDLNFISNQKITA